MYHFYQGCTALSRCCGVHVRPSNMTCFAGGITRLLYCCTSRKNRAATAATYSRTSTRHESVSEKQAQQRCCLCAAAVCVSQHRYCCCVCCCYVLLDCGLLCSVISFVKIWRRCTRIIDDPGVVAQTTPTILYPIYFERPLDIGLVREL